jgi:hypothetical protein
LWTYRLSLSGDDLLWEEGMSSAIPMTMGIAIMRERRMSPILIFGSTTMSSTSVGVITTTINMTVAVT